MPLYKETRSWWLFTDFLRKLRFLRTSSRVLRTQLRSKKKRPSPKKGGPFLFAPRDGHKTNEIDIKNHVFFNIILDKITLPSGLFLRSKSYLSNLYIKQNLSKREIARRLNSSHSTVIEALRKAGIHKNNTNNIQKRKGQIPYGYDYKKGELIKNNKEQEIIGMIKQLKLNGSSLRTIAMELNHKLIPTKNNGTWQANTIRKILQRNRT